MKYLFIVQGEGRGHLTQAISLAQILRKNGHEIGEVLIGRCSNREAYKFFEEKMGTKIQLFESPSMDYGKNGKKGKIMKSIVLNTTPKKLITWHRSMEMIVQRVNETKPDAIVNFYDMLFGLTHLVYRFNVPVVSIAHQFLIDHPDYTHRLKIDYGQFILRLNNMLCSFGSTKTLALSFYPLRDFYRDRLAVLPPLLRKEIFDLKPYNGDYILGYMLNPDYMDDVHAWHKKNPKSKLHFFWDKKNAEPCVAIDEGFTMHKIHDEKFLSFMEGCSGYVTTAGFESICEAMYLGKPVMMIPAHIEQNINAVDSQGVGAGIISDSFDIGKLEKYIPNYTADTERFRQWTKSGEELFVKHLTNLV